MFSPARSRGSRDSIRIADTSSVIVSERSPLLTQRSPTVDQISHGHDGILAVEGNVPTYTLQGLIFGLIIGTWTCIMNTYVGLQTSRVNGLPLATAFVAWFMSKCICSPMTQSQIVFAVTIATSASTMAMTSGLISVIPALQFRAASAGFESLDASCLDLLLWSLALSFFGPLLTMLVNRWFLVTKPLPFPNSVALGRVVSTLYTPSGSEQRQPPTPSNDGTESPETIENAASARLTQVSTSYLWIPSMCSGVWTALARVKFFGIVSGIVKLPSWLQMVLVPSSAIVGTGMIAGYEIAIHALVGLLFGWCLLPLLVSRQVSINVEETENRMEELRLWHALTALLGDCLVTLTITFMVEASSQETSLADSSDAIHSTDNNDWWSSGNSVLGGEALEQQRQQQTEAPETNFSSQINFRLVTSSVLASLACILVVNFTTGRKIQWWCPLVAVLMAVPVGYLGIQTEGTTGAEPVSSLAKMSQMFFGLLPSGPRPQAFTANLIAGAIAEAGAEQAGGLMHHLKVAKDLNASAGAILAGQLIGCVWGAVVSVIVYSYLTRNMSPGDDGGLDIPGTRMWIVAGKAAVDLSWPSVGDISPFAATAVVFAAIGFLRSRRIDRWSRVLVPSGSAFAMGLYVKPPVTLLRLLGGLFQLGLHRGLRWDSTSTQLCGSSVMLGNGLVAAVIILFDFGSQHASIVRDMGSSVEVCR